MTGKKRACSDETTSQSDKRTKIKDVPTIKEEDAAFALQPDVPEKARAVTLVEVSAKAKKAIVPIAATTKLDTTATKVKHGDDINWCDDETEIVDGIDAAKNAFPESEAASEDDIEIVTGDEANTTLIGSEDDFEQAKFEKTDSEEEPFDIRLTDETAKPTSKSTEDDADQKEKVVEKDDSVTKEKVIGDAAKKKTKRKEATEKQESYDAYSAAGRNIIFKGVETSLQFADLAMWVGVGAVGATETRQITVDGVTVEVTVKLLEAKFDAPTIEDSNEVGEKIDFDEEAGDTVLPTTEAFPELTVDTAVASKSGDTPGIFQTASPAAPSIIAHGGRPTACRFGSQCKKRATCMFDHSQPLKKQMCSFVNTNTGCSKGPRCMYSHEHESHMCSFETVRKECPNTFKCPFLHMDDDPPMKVEEMSKFQIADRPVVREASAADIAERAAINRASREASAASTAPPNAPTGPKSNKRSRGADDADTDIQAQRFRHNYQTPTYFNQQQLQPQQWQATPGFAPPPVKFMPPPGGYNSPQGRFIPAQVPYHPQQGFPKSAYAGNQQYDGARGRGRGRGRGDGRTHGGAGLGRGRDNARQNGRQPNGSGGAGQDLDIKVRGAAEIASTGPSVSRIKVQGSGKKA